VSSSSAFATKTESKDDVKTQVTKKISHPGEEEGAVNAQFTVDQDGEIHVIEVQSRNKKLKNFLSKKLRQMNIEVESVNTKEIFNLNFIFKKEY
jgi:hypothetical protein